MEGTQRRSPSVKTWIISTAVAFMLSGASLAAVPGKLNYELDRADRTSDVINAGPNTKVLTRRIATRTGFQIVLENTYERGTETYESDCATLNGKPLTCTVTETQWPIRRAAKMVDLDGDGQDDIVTVAEFEEGDPLTNQGEVVEHVSIPAGLLKFVQGIW